MATVVYSTHYASVTDSVWSTRAAGLFSVKDDMSNPYWESSSDSMNSCEDCSWLVDEYDLFPYDEFRFRPHP